MIGDVVEWGREKGTTEIPPLKGEGGCKTLCNG